MEVKVYCCSPKEGLQCLILDLFLGPGKVATVEQVLAKLPEPLRAQVQDGGLHIASFGQLLSLQSPVGENDRLELLGPILLDVKAARSARVRAARARERGPYNRSYSGVSSKHKA
jgi:putative ubiquitin-RnfH superfamily antitoxin RatB of RatAB toxin-antitoxin module